MTNWRVQAILNHSPTVSNIFHSDKGMTSIQVGVAITLVLVLCFIVAFLWRHEDANWFQSAFERKVQKLHIIQTMSRDLLTSAEAEKSAVMAETDEASQAFAAQSTQAAQNVEKARREFEPLLGSTRQEGQLFQEFSRCWEQLQAIDREVLSLAVQNTNLKALRLSFVPAADAMRRLETALTHLMDVVSSSPNAAGITRSAAQAVIGALNIYTLQAPHIAESTAARMEEMEAAMHSLDAQVTEALQSLQAWVDGPGMPFLDAARAAYQDFQQLNAEIVDLSRQNTNIRSFALSLGQKRKMTAQCQDALAALQETVQQSMAYKATR
jgi:Four helix bundle sensory module for signal transduction